MNIPIFRPETVGTQIASNFEEAFNKIISEGDFIRGKKVIELEGKLADYLETFAVITTANGTDALLASLMATGINEGEEVITPAFGYPAAVEMMCLLKIKPVLIDVEWTTCNMDPAYLTEALSPKTKAVLPIHLFGTSAPIQEIAYFARTHQLTVIEDAAQAFGSEYDDGLRRKKLGTFGELGCTSFFPSKNLGCWGDGGAIFINKKDENLVKKLRRIVSHGQNQKYYHAELGFNSRLDTLQAAVLLQNMLTIEKSFEKRKRISERYCLELHDIAEIELPENNHGLAVPNLFTIRVPHQQRDKLKCYLLSEGIFSQVYYPLPIHLQQAYSPYIRVGSPLSISERLAKTVLSLPCFPSMTDIEQEKVILTLKRFFGKK